MRGVVYGTVYGEPHVQEVRREGGTYSERNVERETERKGEVGKRERQSR